MDSEGIILAPQCAAYTRGHYQLRSDLEALRRVHGSQAREAVAFYAGRVLEVLAAQALDDLGLSPHQTVLSNLDVLEQYSLMPRVTRYFAHGLRRMANDARHILRPISPADARVAVYFVDHWVQWYFHGYSFGPRAQRPTAGGGSQQRPLEEMLEHFNQVTAGEWLAFFEKQDLSGTPVLPALLAESYLDRGRPEDASTTLEEGLKTFGDDPRLTLLRGLYLSRREQLDEALALLEPCFRRYANDSEAAGILAGAYKRMWQKHPDQQKWLRRSFETYSAGWKASHETSTYLGANSATTALWLGRPEASRALAEAVRAILRSRMESLALRLTDPLAAMEYWSGVTLAEVELLAGNIAEGRGIYAKLFSRHAEKQGSIEVTRRQAALILHSLGHSDTQV